jgi:hypothetical protein
MDGQNKSRPIQRFLHILYNSFQNTIYELLYSYWGWDLIFHRGFEAWVAECLREVISDYKPKTTDMGFWALLFSLSTKVFRHLPKASNSCIMDGLHKSRPIQRYILYNSTTYELLLYAEFRGLSWSTLYLCNRCLLPLTLWVWIPLRRGVLDTTLCDKVCQCFATGLWFSRGTPVSSTNKIDCHDITEIFLKVALNTITPCQ